MPEHPRRTVMYIRSEGGQTGSPRRQSAHTRERREMTVVLPLVNIQSVRVAVQHVQKRARGIERSGFGKVRYSLDFGSDSLRGFSQYRRSECEESQASAASS
jgi:hypothetical protein